MRKVVEHMSRDIEMRSKKIEHFKEIMKNLVNRKKNQSRKSIKNETIESYLFRNK